MYMSKSLYFVFYTDDDYMSDRFHLLFNKVNPGGIWKFINIHDDNVLQKIPIKITSLPCVYNVLKKELYEGEFVFGFLRSYDKLKYSKFQKNINERLTLRNDSEIHNVIKIQPRRQTKEEIEQRYVAESSQYDQGGDDRNRYNEY
jgi:hypothetical protein